MPKTRMNDMVKYDNKLNLLSLHGMSDMDMNLFMFLCAEMKSAFEVRETFLDGMVEPIVEYLPKPMTFTFNEIRKSIGYTQTSDKRMREDILRMNEKLLSANTKFRVNGKIYQMPVFGLFATDENAPLLTVQLNYSFVTFFNEIKNQFTLFDLGEFVAIEGKYSKLLFKNLKQFRESGWVEWDIDTFKNLFDIPKSYPNKDIMRLCIKPALKELKPYFINLECKAIYDENKRGKPLKSYRFTFKPEGKQLALKGERKAVKRGRPRKKKEEPGNEVPKGQTNLYDYLDIDPSQLPF